MRTNVIKWTAPIAILALVGCLSATVSEPSTCDTKSVDFGTLPALPASVPSGQTVSVSLPPKTVDFDFSDTVKKVGDVASNLQVAISNLVISNTSHDLDWVRAVDVQVVGSATDGSTPQAALANATFTAPANPVNLNIVMGGDKVLHYFQSGKITLTFTISGDVSSADVSANLSLSNSINLCVAVSGDFSKKL